MNDAYGDPRNYDPNDTGWNPYDFDPTWGPSPDPYVAPPVNPPNPYPNGAGGVEPPQTTGGGGVGKTPAQIEAEGREYDRQHGLIGGYMNGNIWVNGSPYGGPPPRGTGEGGVDPYAPLDIGRPPGSMLPYPAYESAGDFSYEPYTASSWADAENEPGFKEAQDRLSKMVQNSAAYQGVLRSGMTIGKLDSVLDTNRGQNFAQFDARRFRNWDANRGLAYDKFNSHATDVDRGNNYRFNVADRSFADELARWQEQVRSLTTLATPK